MSVPLAYLGIVMIWTTTPLAIKWSGEDVGFLFGVSFRMFVALILSISLVLLLRKALPWNRKSLHTYVAIGIPAYLAMILVYWGAQYIPSGLISVIFGLTPVFTGLLARVWLSEKSFTLPKTLGMILGFVGLIVVFYQGMDVGDAMLFGMLAVLCATFCHSFGTVWFKQVSSELPVLVANTGGLSVTSVLFVITYLILGEPMPESIPNFAAFSIVYLAVFGSTCGAILFYYALKHVSASSIGLLPLITPVTCLLLGQWLNNEIISNSTIIGASIIIFGLIVYQWSILVKAPIKKLTLLSLNAVRYVQNEK